MSSTSHPEPTPRVDSSPDGTRLRVDLVGVFDVPTVVAAMAEARHAAERCAGSFAVLIDVRKFVAGGDALAALSEWETFLRIAGATTVVRVGEGRAVSGADRWAPTLEAAEQLLEE
ncbi:hypothetical protein [Halobaculum limi]|uniref:hypothetical protein n=1 Tax=Halobaculum limi TaxID=3031916 RepID=UPI002406998E|nr:hypothetical protein [Halobaculum sp. YSMS11]